MGSTQPHPQPQPQLQVFGDFVPVPVRTDEVSISEDAPCLRLRVDGKDESGGCDGEGKHELSPRPPDQPGQQPSTPPQSELLPPSRQRIVALLCMPARFVPTDLIALLAPFHEQIAALRLLRHCDAPRQFAAVMEMHTQAAADEMVKEYNNRLFNSLEEVRCMAVFVQQVHLDLQPQPMTRSASPPPEPIPSTSSSEFPSSTSPRNNNGNSQNNSNGGAEVPLPLPPNLVPQRSSGSGAAETVGQMYHLPPMRSSGRDVFPTLRRQGSEPMTCVVCLEKMGDPGSGTGATLTTACNHTFHMACLGQWQDSPCPVCRYHHNLAHISSRCMAVSCCWPKHCVRVV